MQNHWSKLNILKMESNPSIKLTDTHCNTLSYF